MESSSTRNNSKSNSSGGGGGGSSSGSVTANENINQRPAAQAQEDCDVDRVRQRVQELQRHLCEKGILTINNNKTPSVTATTNSAAAASSTIPINTTTNIRDLEHKLSDKGLLRGMPTTNNVHSAVPDTVPVEVPVVGVPVVGNASSGCTVTKTYNFDSANDLESKAMAAAISASELSTPGIRQVILLRDPSGAYSAMAITPAPPPANNDNNDIDTDHTAFSTADSPLIKAELALDYEEIVAERDALRQQLHSIPQAAKVAAKAATTRNDNDPNDHGTKATWIIVMVAALIVGMIGLLVGICVPLLTTGNANSHNNSNTNATANATITNATATATAYAITNAKANAPD